MVQEMTLPDRRCVQRPVKINAAHVGIFIMATGDIYCGTAHYVRSGGQGSMASRMK